MEMQGTVEPSGQPASYFAIELKDLVLVGLDTGIQAGIDDEQGEWLRMVSKLPKDKILLTGKPLVVDATRRRCPIAGSDETVNSIVEDAANRYIAVIAGDIHNFQRYPVHCPDGHRAVHRQRAAGAYTKATHKIPKASLESCGEESDFAATHAGVTRWPHTRSCSIASSPSTSPFPTTWPRRS